MYVRGSDKNVEYKRDLNGFFRGIVVSDFDPLYLQRVKIFIPEITNIETGADMNQFIAPDKDGSIKPNFHQKLLDLLPYAEQASGLWGERGVSHYSAKEKSQVSKATYVENNTRNKVPNSKDGGVYPRMTIANRDNTGAGSSIDAFANINPNAASYIPVNSGPLTSGFYGVPSVGSKVWLFFERGDINLPIYFASCPNMKETMQITKDGTSGTPAGFSTDYNPQGAEDTPPEPLGARVVPGTDVPGTDVTEFVKDFEGYNPNSYWDYGQYSIGYGTKAKPGETTITQEQATSRLNSELSEARGYVERYNASQNRNWSQNQIDALTSFTYNTGPGNLQTLLQGGNRNNQQVADAMLLYKKAGGKTLRGLVRRRQAERQLFLEGYS
tara:strand:- start:335 stop:1486 length:1152 start_codon:yes stop_codon:yes gene_type:complete